MGRDASNFADMLKCYRRDAELTQEELAERANVSVRGIAGLEIGERHVPRRETVRLLANALGLNGEERYQFEAAASSIRARAFPTVLRTVPVSPTSVVGSERDVTGEQAAMGTDIRQTDFTHVTQTEVTQADMAELQRLLSDLKARVEVEAPRDKKDQALERVGELEEAVKAREPDLSTMEYVPNWFGRNLPEMAGTVTEVVVNPIVGALVAAVGEGLADEYRRRFVAEKEQK